MKTNYRKLPKEQLLHNVYSSESFRKDYFKWLRMGGYGPHKQAVNKTVVDYEFYLIDKIESHWLNKWFYGSIDLMDYKKHGQHIPAFVKSLSPRN